MIDISRNCIFLQDSEGRATPFSIDDIRERVLRSLPEGLPEAEAIARDTSLAVDFSLREEGGARGPQYVKASAVDGMVLNILKSIGCASAAEEYRKTSQTALFAEEIPTARIASFLSDSLSLSGERLTQTARKVANTLRSIGADESSPVLILELAKHFLRISDAISNPSFVAPSVHPKDSKRILLEERLPPASETARRLIRMRVLKPQPIDLRILPALRLDLRLFPIQNEKQYAPPLTELTLGTDFAAIAECIDELCLVADDSCRACGRGDAVPLKMMLHFADALLFAREYMGSSTDAAAEECVRSLAEYLCVMLTRQPVKITCA